MERLTYRALLEQLSKLSETDLDAAAVVFDPADGQAFVLRGVEPFDEWLVSEQPDLTYEVREGQPILTVWGAI